jgi:hypothetical protein
LFVNRLRAPGLTPDFTALQVAEIETEELP